MIRKPMKNGLAMLLMMSMVVTLCGCSVFWSEKHEIKNYETKAPETTGTSQEKEEKEMDWEDAVDLAADYLKTMTTEEKVGQLFVVNLEQVDGRKGNYYEFHTCTKTMQKNIEKYHVGGVILFSRNIANRKQTLKMTEGFQNTGRIPLFICVDEEGGSVARIGSNAKMETTSFPTAEEIGKTKDDTYTYQMGKTIGSEIKELGFNVDFAPVADVKTSDLNEEIGDRSFGDDPDKVADYVSAFVQGLKKVNIASAVKHFPGQGSSSGDTHKGSVNIDSSISKLRKVDFVPFESGIEAGADFVMVSHISVSKVTETSVPASMSPLIMQTILREELGFQKIIITDAFDMASITDSFSSADAACTAFQAGADIILMPQNLDEAYQAVLAKVEDGTITQERLNDSVIRILAVKIQRGMLSKEQIKQEKAAESTMSQQPASTAEVTAKAMAKAEKSKTEKVDKKKNKKR